MEKVIGFFGGDHQVGATMVAQSFAEVLQQRGKKVLYLMGSGKFGEEFLPLSGKHSIDDLKASVRSGRVTAEDFYQNLEQIRGLWVLPGVRNQLTAGYFTENTFEVLLSEVSEDFEYGRPQVFCDDAAVKVHSQNDFTAEKYRTAPGEDGRSGD